MKVIWTGDKRYSSEKLPVSVKLEWGNTTFNLLGIIFSVNLDDIPESNTSVTLFQYQIMVLQSN